MIGYLKGIITHKTPAYIYLECTGVGYHVNISLSTYGKLDGKAEALIYTHMHVREDDISLYGFYDEDERQLFVQLISVSGIGCNTARVILSYMNTDELRKAIIHEDEFTLGKVKGIGPKTAKRIILDLKDKIIKTSGLEPSPLSKSGAISSPIREEAMAALMALGFPKAGLDKHINAAMTKNENNNVEELIKNVLKQMN
jgi:holliday junction DNA helicase RuvA